jgi:hypothetical protein
MLPIRSLIHRVATIGSVSAERFREASRPSRIGFVIDTTASRADTWEQAQAVQRRMFDATARLRRLAVRLIHYGGDEVTDHGWAASARDLSAAMAGVRCVKGMTQILPSLRAFLNEEAAQRAQAVILVGDCFEEDVAGVARIAAAFREAGIRIYTLHEGEDPLAQRVFRELADGTGGRFLRFGAALPLGEVIEAIAVLTAGGQRAVARLPNNRAATLLLTGPATNGGARR